MNIGTSYNKTLNFAASKKRNIGTKAPVLTGVDYSSTNTIESNMYSQKDIYKKAKTGCLTKAMKNQLVLRRISTIEQLAEKFVNKHPEFCKEDIIQDLIVITAEAANKYSYSPSPFYLLMKSKENSYFNSLLNSKAKNDSYIVHNASLSASDIVDDFKKETDIINYASAIKEPLEKLTPMQRDVIERLYGLNGKEEETPLEIAQNYGVTRSHIHQIKSKTYETLAGPRFREHFKDIIKD